jgi:hypothetical protein
MSFADPDAYADRHANTHVHAHADVYPHTHAGYAYCDAPARRDAVDHAAADRNALAYNHTVAHGDAAPNTYAPRRRHTSATGDAYGVLPDGNRAAADRDAHSHAHTDASAARDADW